MIVDVVVSAVSFSLVTNSMKNLHFVPKLTVLNQLKHNLNQLSNLVHYGKDITNKRSVITWQESDLFLKQLKLARMSPTQRQFVCYKNVWHDFWFRIY